MCRDRYNAFRQSLIIDPGEQQRQHGGAHGTAASGGGPARSLSVSFRVPDSDDELDAAAASDDEATSGFRGPQGRSAASAASGSGGRRRPPDPVHAVHLARARQLRRQVHASSASSTQQLQQELLQIESELMQELQRVAEASQDKQVGASRRALAIRPMRMKAKNTPVAHQCDGNTCFVHGRLFEIACLNKEHLSCSQWDLKIRFTVYGTKPAERRGAYHSPRSPRSPLHPSPRANGPNGPPTCAQALWRQQHEDQLARLAAAKQRREEQLGLAGDSAEGRRLIEDARRQREQQKAEEAAARAAAERKRREEEEQLRRQQEAEARRKAEQVGPRFEGGGWGSVGRGFAGCCWTSLLAQRLGCGL
jgi:hypothetical protein